ncbi:MAG TPA: Gfo/Idh/MocA family oxidoreductase [Roseiflexaceae bacterium]|nr:Gfo/Idh/MocA family oxidoreductase [Roseiflexaceae bacterium]
MEALRAVVVGAGWAGEGHTLALRNAGVDVVALCGRSPEPTRARAGQLEVPLVRFDWRAAIEELQPEIVSIATPGPTHRAIAEYAAERGCHVVCEKPLASSAEDGRAMLAAAERAGIKHGYAATGRYAPATRLARQLVEQGAIGDIHAIECYDRWSLPDPVPYSWAFCIEEGGGLLANSFTHKLAQVLHITGGQVIAYSGTATIKREHLPVAPMVHDFRQLFGPIPGWDAAKAREWQPTNYDCAYVVVTDIAIGEQGAVRAVFQESLGVAGPYQPKITVYGEQGALALGNGHHEEQVRLLDAKRNTWETAPLPADLVPADDGLIDPVQRSWNSFFGEFVADVQATRPASYPTFYDGVTAMDIIESAWNNDHRTLLKTRTTTQ